MMPLRNPPPRLIDLLPAVRGRYTEDAPLGDATWFRTGGAAEILYRPADRDDLSHFLEMKPGDVPLCAIGAGSNLLVRDGGVAGVVIRMNRAFADIEIAGIEVSAGAMALDVNVASACRDAGLAGLEFLSGIPGTIGGALTMNAGAFGREINDVVVSAEAFDTEGRLHALSQEQLDLSYRHSQIPSDWIVLSATLVGNPGAEIDVARRISEIDALRQASQPTGPRTGGSTFANPSDPKAQGKKAWQLIEDAGCRGLQQGGARVSDQHCNFLINTGRATADELELLGEEVRRRVFEHSGVMLEWEIRRIGVALSRVREARE